MTTDKVYTVDMPGRLADYCEDAAEDTGGDVWKAFKWMPPHRTGRGYVVHVRGTVDTLGWFSDRAQHLLDIAGAAEVTREEIRACRQWLERVKKATEAK